MIYVGNGCYGTDVSESALRMTEKEDSDGLVTVHDCLLPFGV